MQLPFLCVIIYYINTTTFCVAIYEQYEGAVQRRIADGNGGGA